MIDGKEKLIEMINNSVSKEIETNVPVMTQELEKSANNEDLQVKIVDTYLRSIAGDIKGKNITIDDLLYSINTYNTIMFKLYIKNKRKLYNDEEIKAILNMFLVVVGSANESLIHSELSKTGENVV